MTLDSVLILSTLNPTLWKSGASLPNEIHFANSVNYEGTVLVSGGFAQSERAEILQVIIGIDIIIKSVMNT